MKRIYKKIIALFYSKPQILRFCAIFLIFLAIGFKGIESNIYWFWSDYPYIAILLVGVSIFFVSIWIKIEKNKIQEKVEGIKKQYDSKHNKKELKSDMLSPRQHEVLRLILTDKSNKEIMEQLFIEHSTLKTHINKIYKILEIKSRKELRIKYKKFKENK